MGAPKQKWTSEEEEALRAGVAKHGTGKWKLIQKDPQFGNCLAARSNIDLKDKWRNMSVSASGQGSRDKIRTPKLKCLPAPPPSSAQVPVASSIPVAEDGSGDTVMESPKEVSNGKTYPGYPALIFEALSALKDPNGSDINAISGYIEQRHEVPPNFRRFLSSRLRRLVGQDKLERVQNCYRMKKDTPYGTKSPTPKQKDVRPKQPQNTGGHGSCETIEEAASAAAFMIVNAENKSHMASLAVKESERVAKMAEDSDVLLQLAREIYERCSVGETLMIA